MAEDNIKETDLEEEYSQILSTLMMQTQDTKRYIELADEKLVAIRENDTNRMLLVVVEEEKIAQNMIKLEKQRDACIKSIEVKLGKKITNAKSLVTIFSGEDAENIKKVADELRKEVIVLKSKNDINQTLLETSLDQIEIFNNIMTGEKAPQIYTDTKYSKNKNYGPGMDDKGVFDTKY